MTTRRWMIAVAVAAVFLGWSVNRHWGFLKEATAHKAQIIGVNGVYATTFDGECIHSWLDANYMPVSPEQEKRDDWHRKMFIKYRDAADHPWLPVPPDPPKPE